MRNIKSYQQYLLFYHSLKKILVNISLKEIYLGLNAIAYASQSNLRYMVKDDKCAFYLFFQVLLFQIPRQSKNKYPNHTVLLDWIWNIMTRDGNGAGQGRRMGSLSPPHMVLSCPMPIPPCMTRKTFSPHPHPTL